MAAKRQEIEVAGHRLSLSNLDKVLYPEAGFTKGHVIDYYTRVAPVLLPHLRGRPLTLKRYPNGVDKPHFYEKQCPSHRPEWVRTAPIYSRSNRRTIDFCLCDDLPTLVWLANLADLEMHTSLALAEDDALPTVLAFDLDPGAPATIVECAEVALELRAIFAHIGMEAFPKTSGSKGMQVYVPLNTPVTYPQTRDFSHGLAQLLERRRPELVVSEMKKSVRGGKVFVDWSQNAAAQDDRVRVLPAGACAADRFHPADVGGGRGRDRIAGPRRPGLHVRRRALARGRGRGPLRAGARTRTGAPRRALIGGMDLEEHTLEDTLEQTCTVCGARLTGPEIEAAREAGGPFLCSVHAAEQLPAGEAEGDGD